MVTAPLWNVHPPRTLPAWRAPRNSARTFGRHSTHSTSTEGSLERLRTRLSSGPFSGAAINAQTYTPSQHHPSAEDHAVACVTRHNAVRDVVLSGRSLLTTQAGTAAACGNVGPTPAKSCDISISSWLRASCVSGTTPEAATVFTQVERRNIWTQLLAQQKPDSSFGFSFSWRSEEVVRFFPMHHLVCRQCGQTGLISHSS